VLGSTAIWGSTFVVVQEALETVPVFHLLTYRFALGTLLLLPLLRGTKISGLLRDGLWRDGLLVGSAVFVGFILQTAGLLWTTPSRSAFLTGLSVILTPFLAALLGTYRLRPGPIAGTAVAALGLYVLYRPAAGSAPFGVGDLLTLGAAVAFALYIVFVERAVRRHSIARMAVFQFAFIAVLSSPSLLVQPPRAAEFQGRALAAVLILGIFATALAFLGQLYAQRHLTVVEAGVILSSEPVFASALSLALGIEPWTPSLAWGGALILGAILLSELSHRTPPAAIHS
jgi:drug/metabolite transporter (DMT)-like permease